MALHKLLGSTGYVFSHFYLTFIIRRTGQTWKRNSWKIQIKTLWEPPEADLLEGGLAPGQISGQEGSPEAGEAALPRLAVRVLRGRGQPQQPGGHEDVQTPGEEAAAGAQLQAGRRHRQGIVIMVQHLLEILIISSGKDARVRKPKDDKKKKCYWRESSYRAGKS